MVYLLLLSVDTSQSRRLCELLELVTEAEVFFRGCGAGVPAGSDAGVAHPKSALK